MIVRRHVPDAYHALAASGLPPVLARIYAARGITHCRELDHSLTALPDFSSLANVEAAAERLARAIALRERVLVVADYDADGATACAVAVRGLRALGADVGFLVPNRFEYGYGLTPEIVAVALQRAPRLLVTVDNGVASVDGVRAAVQAGCDVLVTDHHLPGRELPSPAIVVDPNQPGCGFPSKHIAGVGVMFYVLTALRARLRHDGRFASAPPPNLAALLDLVALGTVAGVVRLDHVNRIFVEQGLARLRAGRGQPGIAALLRVAGRDVARASASDLGFAVGPRLNAAGRLADMSLGIRCLLADTAQEADPLAHELDRPIASAATSRRRCRTRRSPTSTRCARARRASPSAPTGPRGTRASSASSHRASRIGITARPSCSRTAMPANCAVPDDRSQASTCATRSTSWRSASRD